MQKYNKRYTVRKEQLRQEGVFEEKNEGRQPVHPAADTALHAQASVAKSMTDAKQTEPPTSRSRSAVVTSGAVPAAYQKEKGPGIAMSDVDDTITLPTAGPEPLLPPIAAFSGQAQNAAATAAAAKGRGKRGKGKSKGKSKSKGQSCASTDGAQRKPRKRRVWLIVVLSFVAVALVAAAAWIFIDRPMSAEQRQEYLATLTYHDNVLVGGIDISGLTYQQAQDKLAAQEAEQRESMPVTITYYKESWTLDDEAMGVTYDGQQHLEEALLLGYEGSMLERWKCKADLDANGASYPFGYTYDKDAIQNKVQALANEEIDRAVKQNAAEVLGDGTNTYFEYTSGYEGVATDVPALTAAICSILGDVETKGRTLNVREYATITQPDYTMDELKSATQRISRTVTYMSEESTEDRNYNIRKMANIINGQCIQPGEEWSINDTAGPRSVEAGWKEAPGIENGVFTPQAGGGICQVSSTLYNSLVKADMEITARRSHTIPSSYIQKGWDATISTDGPDLCFRNSSDYPVYILAYADSDSVVVSLYGLPLEDGVEIKLTAEVTDTIQPPDPEYKYSDEYPTGYQDITRDPREGYTVEAYKEYWKDGERVGEPVLMHTDYYPAFSAVVVKGTG